VRHRHLRCDHRVVLRGIQCLRLAQLMRPGAAAGTECQSRLGEGAARRARSAAGAGDRAVVVQRESAQVQRLAELRPAAPKALTGVTQRDAAPAAEQLAREQVPRRLVPQLLALLSLPALQVAQQRPAPRRRAASLRLAGEQRLCVSTAELPRPGSHRQQQWFPVLRAQREFPQRGGDDASQLRLKQWARVREQAARRLLLRDDDARARQQGQLPELSSRAPTALVCGRPGRPRAVSYGCAPEHPSVEGG
jgi:hypothetical protein